MVIKLIISDFDGVLLDLKELHYKALNMALASIDEKFIISPEEHIKIFDGLSTSKKLKLLTGLKNFPLDKSDEVNNLKQKFTVQLLKDFDKINFDILETVSSLKKDGYLFYVASNAIKNTILIGLDKLGISHLVDKIYSNEDVKSPKPNSEIYLRCMIDAGVNPSETIIIEDSKHGREAAVKSGAYVCGIDNSFSFNLSRIKSFISSVKSSTIKWAGEADVTVLIPMAGSGSRFAQEGYQLPKPLIDVNGIPMIQQIFNNLNINANYIFIVQKEHYEKYNLQTYLNLISPGCQIVLSGEIRKGAAWDTLLAKDFINNDRHLIIANSDQLVEWDSCEFMYNMIVSEVDGGILTFKANETKWSYAKIDENGLVSEVAEKKVISDNATVGIYYYRHGSDYVKFAEQMITKDIKTNGEYYVCPVFNEAIQSGKKIKIFPVEKMHGIGTPQDLKHYLEYHKV